MGKRRVRKQRLEITYSCKRCDQRFPSAKELTRHATVHAVRTPATPQAQAKPRCRYCGKTMDDGYTKTLHEFRCPMKDRKNNQMSLTPVRPKNPTRDWE